MNFLLDLGVEEQVLDFLNDNLLETEKTSIELNSDNISSSIKYLKSIGVKLKTIEEILYEDYTILMPGESKLKVAVSNTDSELFVKQLNENPKYMIYLKNF